MKGREKGRGREEEEDEVEDEVGDVEAGKRKRRRQISYVRTNTLGLFLCHNNPLFQLSSKILTVDSVDG